MPTPAELVWKGSGKRGLHQGDQIMLTRWNAGDIVSQNRPVYVRPDYWWEQISNLPNPPYPINASAELWEVPARVLWWDGQLDLMLLEYPSLKGTGHGGKFDGDDDDPYYDLARDDIGILHKQDGCVFIPTCALDLERMGLEPHKDIVATAQYLSDRKWPSGAMIANLAQYGMQGRVIAEVIGISRQAVHKQTLRMPETIRMLTSVYGVGTTVKCCERCDEPTRSRYSRFCERHFKEVCEEQGRHSDFGKAQRRGQGKRPSRAFNFEAAGDISEWLPLVNQTEER